MNVETIVSDVKGRAEIVVTRGQEAFEVGFETFKTANAIVVDSMQTLLQTQVAAGKELIDLAQASFEKIKTDGIKAVASNPIAYLPQGKDTVLGVYSSSMSTVNKAGDDLAKTFKGGYANISASIKGEKKKVAKAAKKATKKTTAARKSAPKAKKAAAATA